MWGEGKSGGWKVGLCIGIVRTRAIALKADVSGNGHFEKVF